MPLDRCEVECVEPERVAAVLERLPAPSVFQDLAETFRVLADPGRVRLISALLEAGELCDGRWGIPLPRPPVPKLPSRCSAPSADRP